jgi:hypothetical protein
VVFEGSVPERPFIFSNIHDSNLLDCLFLDWAGVDNGYDWGWSLGFSAECWNDSGTDVFKSEEFGVWMF